MVMDTFETTHQITFLDGPYEGVKSTLTGRLPFVQIMTTGTEQDPVFNVYVLDENNPNYEKPDYVPIDERQISYKFQRAFGASESPLYFRNNDRMDVKVLGKFVQHLVPHGCWMFLSVFAPRKDKVKKGESDFMAGSANSIPLERKKATIEAIRKLLDFMEQEEKGRQN